MDPDSRSTRKTNPRENASLLSILTFLFTFDIFRKGLKGDFKETDIYEVLEGYKSTKLADNLENEWINEVKQQEKPYILRTLWKIHGKGYFTMGCIRLFTRLTVGILNPLALGKLITYFNKSEQNTSKTEVYYYAAIIMGCFLLKLSFYQTYNLYLAQTSLKINVACSSLIYRRSLKLTTTSLAETKNGKILTLLTKDVHAFKFLVVFGNEFWIAITEIIMLIIIMYLYIGISALIAVSVYVLVAPIQVGISNAVATYRRKAVHKTDRRVWLIQELLSGIKIVKMLTWEDYFTTIITAIRKEEMRSIKILVCLKLIVKLIVALGNKVSFYLCILIYVGLGNQITAEKIFVVLFCYNLLRIDIVYDIGVGMSYIFDTMVSVGRINDFLTKTDTIGTNSGEIINASQERSVSLKNVFVTKNDKDILHNINIDLNTGVTVLTGPVGSGKSTLVMAILKEVQVSKGSVSVNGSMSYSPQEPWLFPGTVKENILLGKPLKQKRYEQVIEACALTKDLRQLPWGDDTVITDGGQNLSRGQKARISLARAVYMDTDIYLIDDSLSAVDNYVSEFIFEKCIKQFLKRKLCILVTHELQFISKADAIVVLSNGTVESVCPKAIENQKFHVTADKNLDRENVYVPTLATDEHVEDGEDKGDDESSPLLKNATNKTVSEDIYHEEKEVGKVAFKTYLTYFKFGGLGKFFLFLLLGFLTEGFSAGSEYFISGWVETEKNISNSRFQNTSNSTMYEHMVKENRNKLKVYSAIMVSATGLLVLKCVILYVFCTTAALRLHEEALAKVVRATMNFFDRNMLGNILNRFSKDMASAEEHLPYILEYCSSLALQISSSLYLVILANPMLLLPSALFLLIMYLMRRYYLTISRSITRLEAVKKSPIIGHFSATLDGLTTVRSCGAETSMKNQFDSHQDLYCSCSYMCTSAESAFNFSLDILVVIYISLVMMSFLLFKDDAHPGKVGLAITRSFALVNLVEWGIQKSSELENLMVHVERIKEYMTLPVENISGSKPEKWPVAGKIEWKNVNLHYPRDSDPTLKDISFIVEPKQKVGIVGRTGAGKSSLISALFRLYEVEGSILIDGVNTKELGLKYLRSKISMIPQDPVLFAGTVRSNLDPHGQYTDLQLWRTLEELDMNRFVKTLDEGLNTNILFGGTNFSLGQKQLLCLARVILSENKILVLDEATANVDPRTEALIQRTIINKFFDRTVITVAHRLNTILDSDKVLVMEDGALIEFDDISVLLQNKNSKFYNMVHKRRIIDK